MPLYYTGAKDGMVEQYNFRVFESILSTQSIIPHMESQYQKGLVIPRLFHELFISFIFFFRKEGLGENTLLSFIIICYTYFWKQNIHVIAFI